VEVPVIAEQTETSAAVTAVESSASEPLETQDVTSAVPSSSPAGEDNPVAPTLSESSASSSPVSTAVVDSVVDRVAPNSSAIVDSADSVATEAAQAVPESLKAVTAVPAGSHQPSEPADGIRQIAAGAVALAVDRLPAAQVGRALRPADLLSSIASTSDEAAAATFGSLPAGKNPSVNGTTKVPELPRAGLFSNQGAIGPELPPSVYLTEITRFQISELSLSKPSDRETAHSPLASPSNTEALTSSAIDRGGRPTPLDVPLPTPESPATAVADSGGPSFVPIVALLALLALVAPTAIRRLGKVADFRAPIPFVCALECPG
jgi:hypothetical protein